MDVPYDNLDEVPQEMLVRILEALGSGARKSHNPDGRQHQLSYLVDKILTLGRFAPFPWLCLFQFFQTLNPKP